MASFNVSILFKTPPERLVPTQYVDSVKLYKNVITEKNDHDVLNKIWLISRMPLNTPHRFQAIIDYNFSRIAQDAKYAFEYYPYMIDVSPHVDRNQNLWLKPNSTEKPILYSK